MNSNERALLMSVAEAILGYHPGEGPLVYRVGDAYGKIIEAEAAQSAEPKPGVVSEEAVIVAIAKMNAIASSPLTPRGERDLRHALEAAAPHICAAKDADTRTVIANNDEKMAEIERLKRQIKTHYSERNELRERAAYWARRFETEAMSNKALRHPDIHTLMERIKAMRVQIMCGGFNGGPYVGNMIDDSARRIVEAIVNPPSHDREAG